jgi:predicted flavoprotein YhiN
MASSQQYQVAVIGGGAAGVFAAITVARLQPSWKVVVIEKTGKLLSKVRVSGGGRCNVTHACFDKKDFPFFYPRGAALVKRVIHHFLLQIPFNGFRSGE